MKLSVMFIAVTLFLQMTISCKKDNDTAPVTKTIEVNLKPGQSYQYDLGIFGDEEGVAITRQAAQYKVSETDRNIPTGKVVYHYEPASSFLGIDEVELKSSRGSDGASPNDKITITIIKFKVQ